MSRTQPSLSEAPTDNAAGFLANLFRGTACIQEAFGQEGGELEYLEKCWSDSAVLQFILLGWIGLALKVLLFILLATLLGACVQGRRPWYVFMSFIKGMGRNVGSLCPCFELSDEDRERERAAEAGNSLGGVWQEEKTSGGYFGIPKQKVLSLKLKRKLIKMLTLIKGVIEQEDKTRFPQGRQCCREDGLQKTEQGESKTISRMNPYKRSALRFALSNCVQSGAVES